MLNFVEIGPPVLEKKFLKGFYHIWDWGPSWSCDTLVSPSYRFFISNLVLIGQWVSEEIFEYNGNIHVYCHGWGRTSP